MGLSGREFLMRVGQAGGNSAAFAMMQSLGLLAIPDADAEDGTLRLVDGKGTRVVILGAGIAGLVSAYELGKAGWWCTALEARERAGGTGRFGAGPPHELMIASSVPIQLPQEFTAG